MVKLKSEAFANTEVKPTAMANDQARFFPAKLPVEPNPADGGRRLEPAKASSETSTDLELEATAAEAGTRRASILARSRSEFLD
jgi:hypothetical protein